MSVILSVAKKHVEYVRSLLIATDFEMPRDRSPAAQDDSV